MVIYEPERRIFEETETAECCALTSYYEKYGFSKLAPKNINGNGSERNKRETSRK